MDGTKMMIEPQRKAKWSVGETCEDNEASEIRCWKAYAEWIEDAYGECSPEWMDHIVNGTSSTCMLPHGHTGAHEWTPDSEIAVEFVTTTGTKLGSEMQGG